MNMTRKRGGVCLLGAGAPHFIGIGLVVGAGPIPFL